MPKVYSVGDQVTAADFNAVIKVAGLYAVDSSGSDAYVFAPSPAIGSYADGDVFTGKVGTANTGAATVNINSVGAKALKKNYNEALTTGDLVAGQQIIFQYDGTNDCFQLLSQLKPQHYVGDLGQTANSAAILTSTQDISLSVDLGFVPRHFSAFISGDAAANRQFDYGSNAGVCRQSAKIEGIIGSSVAYLYVQDDQASLIPSSAPILNPMGGSSLTVPQYVGTFGTGTCSSPGLPSQTPGSSTSSIVFKNITVSGTTITFTWTFTKGDLDCGIRIGVHQLVCHS